MVDYNISLIVTYRPDTKERIKNLEFFRDYYTRVLPNCEIILMETTDTVFNKCKLYNKGFHRAKHNIVCFIDSDIFISEDSIATAYSHAQNSSNIVVGYSGDAIYMSYKFKNTLQNGFTYQDLIRDIQPFNTLRVGITTDMYWVGHTHSVGGCLMMNRECFKDINGFNPNFKNWGYEDDEIVRRSHQLGKNVIRLKKSQNNMLIHLPHIDNNEPKSNHSFYEQNRKIVEMVRGMSAAELADYTKTWTL